jgi:hypothetical protein
MVMKALGAATVSAVVTSLVVTAIRDPSELSTGLIVFFFLYGIPVAGVAALTVGLPAHLLLSRFRVRSLMAYLIAGVIAGRRIRSLARAAPRHPAPSVVARGAPHDRVRIAWRSSRGSDVLAYRRASFSDESPADRQVATLWRPHRTPVAFIRCKELRGAAPPRGPHPS